MDIINVIFNYFKGIVTLLILRFVNIAFCFRNGRGNYATKTSGKKAPETQKSTLSPGLQNILGLLLQVDDYAVKVSAGSVKGKG